MSFPPNDPTSAGSRDASNSAAPITVLDWTCPFCPLLCDDLAITAQSDGALAASGHDCPRLAQALAGFSTSDALSALVDGTPVALDAALERAAEILGASRHPLFGALATDVAGARALYALAASCGATLDHLHGEAMSAATRVVQDRGSFFATLSELRTRADLLIFFGCRPSEGYPRFYERMLGATEFAREYVFVGCEADPGAAGSPHVRTETMLPHADPFDLVALWSALSLGRLPSSLGTLRHDGTATIDALSSLAEKIAVAQYAVLVYEPAALVRSHGQAGASLLIEGLQRIVKAINDKTRAATFALGGADGALTVNQAVTWLSGLPLPLRVPAPRGDDDGDGDGDGSGGTSLDHDAHRYRTTRLIADRHIDALLWVASLAPSPWPPALAADVPAIIVGHAALAEQAAARGAPTVFIPAATPGIDSDGHLFRLDATVVVPLAAARASSLPTIATIASRLDERLAAFSRKARS
ncbi:formylmethanofuran dehydrogenase [Trinickia symbiotica]|uniref:Formylmethanofuran dehydrogenase n=1 Tax=Trinickia symbiotica TaxID=863227 RepID=A0A2T3Y035_9BURK|nr:formylmethanofuran dehydrogenase [Trinickia symbiotica]PTB22101.1 formylmethanofuran dehydrogenase [Trinickia symbiotica]